MEFLIQIILKHEYKKIIIELAKTCKCLLRAVLNRDNLIQLVNLYIDDIESYDCRCMELYSHHHRDKCVKSLPFFLYASIPQYLVNIPYLQIDSKLKLKNCCVAGGYIVKKVYNLKYISDIDIWVVKDKETSIMLNLHNMSHEISKCDIIIIDEPYTNISGVDLSIC